MEIDAYLSEKQKYRKKRQAYIRIAMAFIAVYAVIIACAWFVLRSPVFAVRNVVVKGNYAVSSDAVVAVLRSAALRDHDFWRSLMGFRNMMTWPGSLSRNDLVFLPQVASIAIEKSYLSHTITATVTERKPFAIWCFMPKIDAAGHQTGDPACYSFDKDGILFERTFDTQGSLISSIHDYSQKNPGLEGSILAPRFIPNLVSIVDAVRASGLDAEEVALKDMDLQEVQISTYGGPTIYFSLRFPAENDVQVLKNLLAKPGFKNLQYVDFRVENRAYYK